MVKIDMEMPEKCGLCPLFHAEHPMYCQGIKADHKKKIVAPYGQPRPDWCPLHPLDAVSKAETVTINDTADEIKVTNCNHNAEVGKMVSSLWPHENGKDAIYRRDAIDAINSHFGFNIEEEYGSAVQEVINGLPSAQQKQKAGKWSEKEVIHKSEAETVIEEWQSCKCSVCGRYDTRPYLYYFDEPHFCSWCGADMRGE